MMSENKNISIRKDSAADADLGKIDKSVLKASKKGKLGRFPIEEIYNEPKAKDTRKN